MLSHHNEERDMIRRRPFPACAVAEQQPIGTLNTTPLIDVMLVLLIMFIVTIPIASHKVAVDLPNGPPAQQEPVIHRITLDAAGTVRLDGAPVGLADLQERLARLHAAAPDSDFVLQADGEAPYARFDAVAAAVKRAGIVRLGMADNQRFVAALD
jgi:biopolymer transport protein ExbD